MYEWQIQRSCGVVIMSAQVCTSAHDTIRKTCRTYSHTFPATGGVYNCYDGANCFSDRTCFGERPEFANNCPLPCERALQNCRHEKKEVCWSRFVTGGEAINPHDADKELQHLCHRGWDRYRIGDRFWSVRDRYAHYDKYGEYDGGSMRNFHDSKFSVQTALAKKVLTDIYNTLIDPPDQTAMKALGVEGFCDSAAASANSLVKHSDEECNAHPCCEWHRDWSDWEGKCRGRRGDNNVVVGTGCFDKIIPLKNAVSSRSAEERARDDWHHEDEDDISGAILRQFNVADGQCWRCEGDWNRHDTWETPVLGNALPDDEICLAEVTAVSSVCSGCVTGCERDCHREYQDAQSCRHVRVKNDPKREWR